MVARKLHCTCLLQDLWVQLAGVPHIIGEHINECFCVLELRGQPGSDHIVRICHAFDAVPVDIGVRLVRAHRNRFPGLEFEVIEEVADKYPDVEGELLIQVEYELVSCGWVWLG